VTWPGATLADEDHATRAVLEKTTARGRVMLSGSHARGHFLGRVCVLSFRTHQRHIDELVEDLSASIAETMPTR